MKELMKELARLAFEVLRFALCIAAIVLLCVDNTKVAFIMLTVYLSLDFFRAVAVFCKEHIAKK